jgi:hypothetical protein
MSIARCIPFVESLESRQLFSAAAPAALSSTPAIPPTADHRTAAPSIVAVFRGISISAVDHKNGKLVFTITAQSRAGALAGKITSEHNKVSKFKGTLSGPNLTLQFTSGITGSITGKISTNGLKITGHYNINSHDGPDHGSFTLTR